MKTRQPPRVSRPLLRLFTAYTRFYLRRHFVSIRLLNRNLPIQEIPRPLVVFLNHASWWDPLVCLRLAEAFFASRTCYAPIAAASLRVYGYFKLLGFYGVNPGRFGDTLRFIRITRALLSNERNAVWLTPQGRFRDARERPLRLQPGIGLLASLTPAAAFLPLAIEYPFWEERRPEILVSFGRPIIPAECRAKTSSDWTEFFARMLETEQDVLARAAQHRKPSDWLVLDEGPAASSASPAYRRRLRSLTSRGGFLFGRKAKEL